MKNFKYQPYEDANTIIIGNYISVKSSGYYNGNRVSWHTYKVVWLLGEYDDINDYQHVLDFSSICEFSDIKCLETTSTYGDFCYRIVGDKIAESNKRDARKLILKLHEVDGFITKAYSLENHCVYAHTISSDGETIKNV